MHYYAFFVFNRFLIDPTEEVQGICKRYYACKRTHVYIVHSISQVQSTSVGIGHIVL